MQKKRVQVMQKSIQLDQDSVSALLFSSRFLSEMKTNVCIVVVSMHFVTIQKMIDSIPRVVIRSFEHGIVDVTV